MLNSILKKKILGGYMDIYISIYGPLIHDSAIYSIDKSVQIGKIEQVTLFF